MPVTQWTAAFSAAFTELRAELEHHRQPGINAYAATVPAEFFAVACEYFFTAPHTLRNHYPAIYPQLQAYFRQNPLTRFAQD